MLVLSLLLIISSAVAAAEARNSSWYQMDKNYYLNVTTVLQSANISINGTQLNVLTLQQNQNTFMAFKNSLVFVMKDIYDEADLTSTLIDILAVNYNPTAKMYEMTACTFVKSSEMLTLDTVAFKLSTAVHSLNLANPTTFTAAFGNATVAINATSVAVLTMPNIMSIFETPGGIAIFAVVGFLGLTILLSAICHSHYSKKHEKMRMTLVNPQQRGQVGNADNNFEEEFPTSVAWN